MMTEKERLFASLDRDPVDRVPCASPLQTGTVELMAFSGAYWPEAHRVPSVMASLAKAAHTCAGIESVRVPFDVTVDATTFGATTGLERTDRQPAVTEAPFASGDGTDISIPDPLSDGRAPVLLDALRALKTDKELNEVPIICGVVGPFMLTCQLRGIEKTMMEISVEPGAIYPILEKATEWCKLFCGEAGRAGADVITVIDATSTGDILGPDQYRSFAMPYHRNIARHLADIDLRSVLHICGNIKKNLAMMSDCGFDGISVDQCMDIAWAKAKMNGRTACVGNVDPTSTLLTKGPEVVRAETLEVVRKGSDIIAPGCGFAPRTPLMNIRAMSEAVKNLLNG